MSLPPEWTALGPLEDFSIGSLTTQRVGGRQLVVVRRDDGEISCLDNHCPHEGYPLVQGKLDGDTLTCVWHNWKFDVGTGACRLGGEAVRAYPTRVNGSQVEVDLRDPDPALLHPSLVASLLDGVHDNDLTRSIRDAVRLVATGYEPHQLLAELARDDARRAEYGTTHVLAVAADCGRFLKSRPGAAAVYAIAPVIDLSIEESQRLSAHPAVEAATDLPDDDAAICHRLNAAVEAEDLPRAESILRGAHAMGRVRSTIETWLFDLLAEHFLSFGHPLIYLIKARELLDRVGDAAARDIHCGLLRGIVYGTREDTLPYMRAYAQRLAEATVELEDLHRRQDTTADAAFDARAFVDAVLDAPSPGGACDQLMAALRAGVSAQLIAESLVIAGAHRFARFDVAHEQNPDLAENWLWATHRFTFAAAVRHAVAGFDRPRSLRFLFQALMFIHSGRRMDLPLEARENSILSGPAGEGASAQAIMEAIGKKDATSAVRRLRSLLRNRDEAALRQLRVALEAFCLNDPVVRPIVLAHVIKLVVAAFEEWEHLADQEEAGIPLLGLVRFLASPIQERRVHSAVHASIGWVVEGLVPRKLTQ